MTYKDFEFFSYFDSLVERCLSRICGPAREHFADPIAKLPALMGMTNIHDKKLILASIRRLVRSGRITRANRRFQGRNVTGIVCLPRADWERLNRSLATGLQLSDGDVGFLRSAGVAVDPEDVREPVAVD